LGALPIGRIQGSYEVPPSGLSMELFILQEYEDEWWTTMETDGSHVNDVNVL